VGNPCSCGRCGEHAAPPPSNGDRLLSRNLGSYLGKKD
jgi:hypothetical protein